MFDLFGRKARAELAALHAQLRGEVVAHAAVEKAFGKQIDSLTHQLREVDQIVYKLSQCYPGGETQQLLATLVDRCSKRQRDESNRIEKVLIPEIRKTYTEPERDVNSVMTAKRPRIIEDKS